MIKTAIRKLVGPARSQQLARYQSGAEMLFLAICGNLPIHRLRVASLRLWGAAIDPQAVVYHGVQVRAAKNLILGPRVNVGDGATLDARGGLSIGADTNLSSRVEIWTAQHKRDSPDFEYEEAPVSVGEHVWIGPRVTILPGARIGDGAIVAAGAVVKGDVAPHTMVGGVPAKVIGHREAALTYHLPSPKTKTPWW